LNESRKLDPSAHETGEKARKQLEEVENELINVQQRITYLHNEPEIYEQEFLRDLRTGVLDRLNRNGIVKVLVLAAFLLTFGFSAHAQGKSSLNIVIGIDLSKSVATSGYDGQSEFAKNVQAAEDLIFGLPPASRITVLALTDQSFSRAYILTRGELPDAKRPLPF